jgi:hypothetical protein
MATLKLTEEKAMPLIAWLDSFEGDTHEKVSSAIFFLIARRRMVKNDISKEELLQLIAAIYDVVAHDDFSSIHWANDD